MTFFLSSLILQLAKLKIVFNQPLKVGVAGSSVWKYAFNVFITTAVKPEIWKTWTVEDLVYADSRGRDEGIPPLNSPHRMYAAAKFTTYFAGSNGENPTQPLDQKPNRRPWQAGAGAGYPRVSTFYKAARTTIGSWNGDDQIIDTTGEPEDAFMIKGDLDVLNSNDKSRLDVKNAKLITLLPPGLEFEKGSETNGFAGKSLVIRNFKNTGKTAVIIPFGTVTWAEDNSQSASRQWHAQRVERYVEFKVHPTSDLEYGDNFVMQYLIWDNNEDVLPPSDERKSQKKPYTDILNLDDDGNVNEVFLEGKNNVFYRPQLAVGLRKHISEDKVNWKSGISNFLDIGTEFYYRLSLSNRFPTPLNHAAVIDVLPAIGDKRIVPNDAGIYGNRNSVFSVSLTQSLESLPENEEFFKKWNVLYSEQDQGSTTDETINKNFVSANMINDWSKIKMFKLILKPGENIQGQETSQVIIPAKIPLRKDLNIFDKAYNTAAFQTDMIDNKYREVSSVAVPVARYFVTGVAFQDVNNDGKKNRNEPVLLGYNVQLMNEDNKQPVIDPLTGNHITDVTDDKGVYKLDVFKRGNYYIKVIKNENTETFTSLYEENGKIKTGTSSIKDGVIGNDTSQIDDMSGRTTSFELSPLVIPFGLDGQTTAKQLYTLATENNTLFVTRNIGFNQVATSKLDVPVKKIWQDNTNQDGKRPQDLEVLLTQTIEGVTTDTTHKATLSGVGNEWTHTFTGLPKYENGKLITYGVKEVTVPQGYTSQITVTKEGILTIINTYSVKKVGNKLPETGQFTSGLEILAILLILSAFYVNKFKKV